MKVCHWADIKKGKLFRCTSKATEVVTIDGESYDFCHTHATIAKGLLAKKARYDKLVSEAVSQLNDHVTNIKALKAAICAKEGTMIKCPRCSKEFPHSGKIEFQVCPKCHKEFIL